MLLLTTGALSLSSCSRYMVHGDYLGYNESTVVKKLDDKPINAEACRQWIFFIPFGEVSWSEAIKNAVAQAPAGTTGLANVSVQFYSSRPAWGVLAGRECFKVQGVPAKATL